MDTGVGPRSRITAVRSASKCLSVESADPPLRGLLGWCKGSLRRSLRAPDRQRPQSPERIALIGVLICGNTTLLKPWTRGWPGEPGELWLRVVDTPAGEKSVHVYDVIDHGTKLANGRVFFNAMPGYADGIRCDTQGNVWCGFSGGEGHDGAAVFAPDGKLIGRILLPERCANLCFGGRKRNRLFMTASQSVYAVYVEAQGVLGG